MNRVYPDDEEKGASLCTESRHGDVQKIIKGELLGDKEFLFKYKHKPCGSRTCPLRFFQNDEIDHGLSKASILFLAVALLSPKPLPKGFLERNQDRIRTPIDNDEYQGLTPFHLAVAIGDCKLVKEMWKKAGQEKTILTQAATGKEINGTVFMAKLPFSIAACLNKKEIVDFFLAEVTVQDFNLFSGQSGTAWDNVFHSMVRFAKCFPNKTDDVLEMLNYLISKPTGLNILKRRNKDNKTALQLSAEYGLVDFYQFLVKSNRHITNYDHAYERRSYDITDIDKSALIHWKKIKASLKASQGDASNNTEPGTAQSVMTQQSVCESICGQPLSIAVKMIDNEAVLEMLRVKWEDWRYRVIALGITILHMSLMCGLLVFGSQRSGGNPSINVIMSGFICMIGLCYIFVEVVVRRFMAKQPFCLRKPHHNIVYNVAAILFGLCLVVDSGMYIICLKDSWFLYYSMIPGTWYLLCYLRWITFLGFGGYIVIINEAVVFCIPIVSIILLKLFLSTTVLHIRLRNSSDQDVSSHFESFGSSLLSMFRLMTALADLDGLEKTVESPYAIIFYVLFVATISIFLMNALIAILTNQFQPNFEHRSEILYLQRLSLLVFIDGVLAAVAPWYVIPCQGKYVKRGESMNQPFDERMNQASDEGMNQTFDEGMNQPFDERIIMSFRKVRFDEYEHPKGIEHDRSEHFRGIQFAIDQSILENKRLERLEAEAENVKKKLDSLLQLVSKLVDSKTEDQVDSKTEDQVDSKTEDQVDSRTEDFNNKPPIGTRHQTTDRGPLALNTNT